MSNQASEEAVKSAQAAVTATLVAAAAGRLRDVYYVSGASAGTLVFKDGGSSGTIILTINTPAGVTLSDNIPVPGGGISFGTDLHVTVTNTAFVTVLYGSDNTL